METTENSPYKEKAQTNNPELVLQGKGTDQ